MYVRVCMYEYARVCALVCVKAEAKWWQYVIFFLYLFGVTLSLAYVILEKQEHLAVFFLSFLIPWCK